MRERKLRLGSCRECHRMLVVAVTGDGVAPYHDECVGCGSMLDGESVARTGVDAGD